MEITAKCSEAKFSLTGEDEEECIKGVGRFKYIRRLLDWSENDWPSVLQNISKERKVWGRLRKIFWREGGETAVSEKFYHTIVQAVLFFGTDTWVLTETMSQRILGAHVSFLRQITHKQASWQRDGYWRQMKAEEVLQGAGTQMLRNYVARRQATVAEWVTTIPIFDVCARWTG